MHRIILALPLIAMMACAGNQEPETTQIIEEVEVTSHYYGDSISADGAISPELFLTQMEGKDSLQVKLMATIKETCQKKGCWMMMDMENGNEMRVGFKDYGFFVPTEGVDGKKAILEGYAYTDTVSVDMLQHLAEDGGKSPEEIALITEPEVGVNFEAVGVIIMD